MRAELKIDADDMAGMQIQPTSLGVTIRFIGCFHSTLAEVVINGDSDLLMADIYQAFRVAEDCLAKEEAAKAGSKAA